MPKQKKLTQQEICEQIAGLELKDLLAVKSFADKSVFSMEEALKQQVAAAQEELQLIKAQS